MATKKEKRNPNERREFAARYLKKKREEKPDEGWAGPTEIGLKMGFNYSQASSKMMSALRTLLKHGEVEQEGGKYRWAEVPK